MVENIYFIYVGVPALNKIITDDIIFYYYYDFEDKITFYISCESCDSKHPTRTLINCTDDPSPFCIPMS